MNRYLLQVSLSLPMFILNSENRQSKASNLSVYLAIKFTKTCNIKIPLEFNVVHSAGGSKQNNAVLYVSVF